MLGRPLSRSRTGSRRSIRTAPSGSSTRSTRRRCLRSTGSHTLAPQHPEWKTREPFKAVLTGDMEAIGTFPSPDWAEIVAVTHSRHEPRRPSCRDRQSWMATARHPKFDVLHRARLSADARGDGPPSRERVQDVHRNRWWTGVRACVCRSASTASHLSRSSAPASMTRYEVQRRQADAHARAEGVPRRRSTAASRSASTCSSASGPVVAFGNSDGGRRDVPVDDSARRRSASDDARPP